jgi:hypothetical protein
MRAEEVRRAVRWAGSQHSDNAWQLCQSRQRQGGRGVAQSNGVGE